MTREPIPVSAEQEHPKGKGCWYYTVVFECPICSASETFRERRWTEKPVDPRERYEWNQTSGCSDHFL